MNTAALPRVPRQIVLFGTPALLVLVELTHPTQPTQANASWWVAIHVIQLPLFGLFALALLLALDGVRGLAATLSRVGVGIFVVYYTFLDSTAGIAAGIWLEGERGLSGVPLAGAEHVLAGFWSDPARQTLVGVGYAGLLVAMLGACIALSGARDVRLPLGLLLLGSLLDIVAWGIDVPVIGPLRLLGPVLGALGAALALYWAGAPHSRSASARWLLILPLALVVASPLLIALFTDDPYEAIGLTVGALGVAAAVALAARPRVATLDADGLRILPLVPLVFSAVVLSFDHAFPYGPIGFASFLLAAAWLARGRSPAALVEASVSADVGGGRGTAGAPSVEPMM